MLRSEILLSEVGSHTGDDGRGSNWAYEKGSKPWTTGEPFFWTAAMFNAISIDFATGLFRGFSMITKQLMAFFL